MKNYLLDTNICIYFLKGRYGLDEKFAEVGEEQCAISEITVAELKYGVANSKTPHTLRPVVEAFIPKFAVVPIFGALDVYAVEKARLRKLGLLVDDFDLLIGATAIAHDLVMVTANVQHLGRLQNIRLENWATD